MKPLKTETVFFIYKVKDSPNLDESPVTLGKEMDTYKVATVANSESTMHRLAKTPITINCFSFDFKGNNQHYSETDTEHTYNISFDETLVDFLEELRIQYLNTNNNMYWRRLIQLLPSSWNQKRHWTSNYATLLNICGSREGHRLSEWKEFIGVVKRSCPYFPELLEAYNER